jgi:hypothetical protein
LSTSIAFGYITGAGAAGAVAAGVFCAGAATGAATSAMSPAQSAITMLFRIGLVFLSRVKAGP